MPDRINFDRISRVFSAICEAQGLKLEYTDQSTREVTVVDRDAAAAPDGLLPVILVSAEAVWREATGRGFALDLEEDPDAVLGFRVVGMANAPFTVVMLCVMEALGQVTDGQTVAVDALAEATRRALQRADTIGLLARAKERT